MFTERYLVNIINFWAITVTNFTQETKESQLKYIGNAVIII